jgi:hypothetical protein
MDPGPPALLAVPFLLISLEYLLPALAKKEKMAARGTKVRINIRTGAHPEMAVFVVPTTAWILYQPDPKQAESVVQGDARKIYYHLTSQ